MATSLRDLLAELDAALVDAPTESVTAQAAIGALGHLGRGLGSALETGLLDDAGDHDHPAMLLRELAVSARAAERQWPASDHRLSDLAGVAADLACVKMIDLDQPARHQIAIELARRITACAELARRFPPFTRIPALERIARVATAARRYTDRGSAPPELTTALNDAVPSALHAHPDPSGRLIEASAALAHHARSTRDRPMTTHELLAVASVAELVAERTEAAPPTAWVVGAPAAWRALTARLAAFDDGSRFSREPCSRVIRAAASVKRALAELPTDEVRSPAVSYAATLLPALACTTAANLHRSAAEGRLFAPARALPNSDRTTAAAIRGKAVMVKPADLREVESRARKAHAASKALIEAIDRRVPASQRAGTRQLDVASGGHAVTT